MKTLALPLAFGTLFAAAALPVHAGDGSGPGFYGALGYASVQPKSGNGTLAGAFKADIDNDAEPVLTLGYRFDGNWSAEAWLPLTKFKHDVRLDGARSARIKHMPLLLTAQYRFLPGNSVQPFVGAGYGWVDVTGERTTGPIAGTHLDVKRNDGITAQLGVDFFATDNLFVRAEARYFDWTSKVTLNGADIGKVKVDPWIYGVSIGYAF